MENLKKMIKEKKEFSVACVIIVILLIVTIYLAISKQVPKLKDGSEVIASVKEVKFTDEDEEYVDNMIDYYKQYADYYGVSFEDFIAQYVGISGVSTEKEFREYVKADYKKSLAVINYVGKQASKEEIQKYYDENYSKKLTAKHILIETSDEVSEEDALKEAKDLIAQLNEVKDDSKKLNELFEDLAYKHSADGTYSNGGLIEDFSKSDVVSEFWDAADKLKDGEFTSEPVKTEYGYHIILKVSSSKQDKLEDIKDEVIKALAQSKLSNDQNLQVTAWDELRRKYNFKINDSDIKKEYNDIIDSYKNTDDTDTDNSNNDSESTEK